MGRALVRTSRLRAHARARPRRPYGKRDPPTTSEIRAVCVVAVFSIAAFFGGVAATGTVVYYTSNYSSHYIFYSATQWLPLLSLGYPSRVKGGLQEMRTVVELMGTTLRFL